MSVAVGSTLAWVAVVLAGAMLVGCANEDPPVPRVEVAGAVFEVEIADTEAERAIGLSGRRSLPSDHGMLFLFDRPQLLEFHMKDCYMPIDIAFLDADRRILNLATMPVEPAPARPTRQYVSFGPAQYALETAGGTWERIGAEPGMIVQFHRIPGQD